MSWCTIPAGSRAERCLQIKDVKAKIQSQEGADKYPEGTKLLWKGTVCSLCCVVSLAKWQSVGVCMKRHDVTRHPSFTQARLHASSVAGGHL